jgi:hypothetical protein
MKSASLILAAGLIAASGSSFAEEPKFKADVPAKITTPEKVETSIGTLMFKDGAPDEATAKAVYDNLDRMRGVDAFLRGMSATSVRAMCNGLESAGVKPNQGFGITEDLLNARSLFLTPNTTTVYAFGCIDLNEGPVVMEVPTGVLGPVDDADFEWVTDIGLTGPDAGKGGKYLFIPPGYKDALPTEGYFEAKPKSNTVLVFFRAFVKGGDIAASVKHVKEGAKLYHLNASTESGEPPATTWVNTSGMQFNTISANDFSFYEELNQVVQTEPADFVDADTIGLYASIGIKKGQPFAPDERMKKILTDAVAIGNATARTLLFQNRDPRTKFYTDRQWTTPFVGGSYQFLDGAERLLDARSMFFYYATGITPSMSFAKVGSGSAYAGAFKDSKGEFLDGSKTYKVTLPGPIPAKDFWSFVVYDNQTRSLLETDQQFAGLDSNDKKLKIEADGSATIWFGPKAPEGHETNWIQTMPGKGWNVLLRLYGPLEPWFDKKWKPGDLEPVE